MGGLEGKLKSAFLLKIGFQHPYVSNSPAIEPSVALHRGINRGILIYTAFLLIRNFAVPGVEGSTNVFESKTETPCLMFTWENLGFGCS